MSKKNQSKSRNRKDKKGKNPLKNKGQTSKEFNQNQASKMIATPPASPRVQPEQMSLDAHQHIQQYLKSCGKANLG